VSSIDTGFETGEAGRLSNRQSHSPPSPNPFRTDFMPRNFLVLLNTFACVMRWPSPSSPAARAITSSLGTPKASSARASRKNWVTFVSEGGRRMVIVILEWLSLLASGKYAWPDACSQCQQSTIPWATAPLDPRQRDVTPLISDGK